MTGQDCILMMRNVEHLLDFFRIAVLKLLTGGHNWLFQRHKAEALTRVMSGSSNSYRSLTILIRLLFSSPSPRYVIWILINWFPFTNCNDIASAYFWDVSAQPREGSALK